MIYFFAIVFGYLAGSLPTGYLAAKRRGMDIRAQGSGNIGATNVFRILGWKAGVTVLFVDGLKGWIGCKGGLWLMGTSGGNPIWILIVGGFASVLGHNYTPWLRFKGGKGIATSAGVLVALTPWGFLGALTSFLVFLGISRMVSLGSIMAAVALPVVVWYRQEPGPILGVCILMSLLAIVKHRANIQRILQGTESKIGQKKPGKGKVSS
jgi:glycerol-3-phosphate acyltransferase PlsY